MENPKYIVGDEIYYIGMFGMRTGKITAIFTNNIGFVYEIEYAAAIDDKHKAGVFVLKENEIYLSL